ncbi:MAG TPA: PTS cellobiose transporter subunit IIC [Selenomonas sp.]|nr:PTS cellobiose transporter subunit IIC [Selenomonas sp.]
MTAQSIQERLNLLAWLADLRAVRTVRSGLGLAGTLALPASVLLLVAEFPVPGWGEFWAGVFGAGWQAPLCKAARAVFSFMALTAAFGTAYQYAKDDAQEPMPAGLLGGAVFLTLVPWETGTAASAAPMSETLPLRYLGFEGLFGALVVGCLTGALYCWAQKHPLPLPFKVSEEVPDGVKGTFRAIVPGTLVLLVAAVLAGILAQLQVENSVALVADYIEGPLMAIVDTVAGGVIIFGAAPLMFWAGMHGPAIVGAFTDPMLTANMLANQALLDAGGQLAGNPAAHIVTQQIGVFATMGGCGLGLGFLVAVLVGARSQQLRSLVSYSGVPALFNINEPLIYGAPLCLNPYFLVPFILAPVAAFLLTYAAIATGVMPPFSAVQVPWCTPPVISGFLMAGPAGALVQIICIIMGGVIYLPFVIAQDRAYQKEAQQQ